MYSFRSYFWHEACQVPYMEVNMFISSKQMTYVATVVQVYISKLNTDMIDRLRQLKQSLYYDIRPIQKNLRLPHKGTCLSDG